MTAHDDRELLYSARDVEMLLAETEARAVAAETALTATASTLREAYVDAILNPQQPIPSDKQALNRLFGAIEDAFVLLDVPGQPNPTEATMGDEAGQFGRLRLAEQAFLRRMRDRDPANDETVEVSGYDFWTLVQLAERGGQGDVPDQPNPTRADT